MVIPVLYVSRQLDFGGAENQLLQLLMRLDRGLFQPYVCNLTGGGGIEEEIAALGIPIIRVEKTSRYTLKPLAVLGKFILRHKIKIVHSIGVPAHLWTTPVARAVKVPAVVYSDHQGVQRSNHNKCLSRLNGLVSKLDDVIVAHSQKNEMRLHLVDGVARNKTRVIYNGVEVAKYAASAAAGKLQEELGLARQTPVVAMIGRFVQGKAYNEFFQAARVVIAQGAPGHFICVGDGPNRLDMEKLVQDLGLSRQISFLGWRADVPALLADCAVLVLASHSEGLPIVILEAMAAGLPVVSSDVGGCDEAIIDGETGFLVPPGDYEEMAAKVYQLITNQDLAQSLGQAGQRRVGQYFDIEVTCRQTQDLYLELLAQK